MNLIEQEKLITNFNQLKSWEEKYIFLIELGYTLKNIPDTLYQEQHKVFGCQSKVWIDILLVSNNIKFYGDSDSSIVKGLIALVFLFYKNMTVNEVLNHNIYDCIERLSLTNHLTSSRSQGLKSIILYINKKAKELKTFN